MAYGDLNIIRARLALSIEDSKHTSAYRRLTAQQAQRKLDQFKDMLADAAAPSEKQQALLDAQEAIKNADAWLTPIDNRGDGDTIKGAIPLSTDEYLSLLDWMGRQFHKGKPGVIPNHLPPILNRLALDVENWLDNVKRYGSLFWRVVGRAEAVAAAAAKAGRKWFKGVGSPDSLYDAVVQ